MTRILLACLLSVITTISVYGQVPTVQDCDGAIPVCQNTYFEPNSYVGVGNIPNEINSGISCLGGGEVNDVWYTFTVQTSGMLCFTITPNVSADDYDWAVYDLTNDPCSAIATNPALEVGCNFSGVSGPTGANGNAGAQNEPCIPVTAGSTFVLNVSNWSGSGNGYTLDFGASTATIFDNIPPAIQAVQTPIPCGATTLTFTFTEAILCNTLSTADLVLNGPGGPYTITNVTGVVCAAGGNQENEFTITITPPITTAGNYTLDLVGGAGFVTDLCGNVAGPGSLPFTVSNTIGWNIVWSDETCAGDNDGSITVTGNGGTAPYSYDIDDGINPPQSNGTGIFTNLPPGTYTVTVTDNSGCSTTTTVVVAPGINCCGADAGTTTSSMSGQGTNNFILCDGDFIDICGNNDHINPADVGPIGPYVYNPGIGFGVYECPPTPGLDPLSDPCFLGMVPGAPGICMQDQNVSGSAAGLLGGVIGGGANIINNTLYFAPITLYDAPALAYNTNCVETGPYTTVQYLEPITYTATEDCANQEWDITITGGWPNMFGGNFTISNLVVTPVNGGAALSTTTVADGGTVSVTGLNFGDTFTFDVTDPNGCTITVNGGPYTCCPADAGTATASMTGQGNQNYILCDGDIIDITTDGNYTNSPGVAPGITYGIYICPPTPGIDPALDPCYTGYVTGSIWDMTDQNIGGSAGGLLGALIGLGITPTNNTLYFAPFTLIDTVGLFYDPTCFDIGPAIPVQYLEPITYTATEDCANQQWDIVINGGYAQMMGGNFTISNLIVTPANGGAALSTTTIPDGGTVSVTGLNFGDTFTFDVTDGNGCTITVTGGPYTCCPAFAGTSTATMSGQSNNNFVLCVGDVIDISTDGNHINSPGAAPGISFAIYTCPPTPGLDPALDPCYSGFLTGTIWNFQDINIGGSGGGLLGWLIGQGVIVTNNTLYFHPFTLVDTVGGLWYDPNCFDVGPPITVQYLEPFVWTQTPTNSTCGNSDGQIDLAVTSGGLAPYQYEVIGIGGPQAGTNFSGIASGTYDAVVHDSNGCTDTAQVTIIDAGAPNIDNILTTDPSCFGVCDGIIDVQVSGGSLPYTYDIGGPTQPGGIFNGVCDGTYTVTVVDNNGCSVTQNVTLTEPPQVTISATHVDLLCYQDSVGVGNITITGGGGTGAYQYSIDGGVTWSPTASFDDLGAGTYNLVVEDANGCQATMTETIIEPTELTITFSTFDATCFGFCDGSAIVIPAGGTGAYTYNWTNGIAGPNDAQASNLCVGTETLTVTDANGCSVDTTFTISAPVAVSIDAVTIIDVSCDAICDGQIDITAPLATQFSIDNGATFSPNNVFTNLCAGTYDIIVENANGCQATQQVVVNSPPPVAITVSLDTTICLGGTASLTGNATGGSGGFVYVWDNGLPPNQNVSVSPVINTTYCVYAVDANGCQTPTVCVDVNLAAPLTVTAGPDANICPGESATITAVATGGDGNYTYTWDNAMTGSTITVSPTTTTVYTVTVTDGCSTPAATDFATITVDPTPNVTFIADVTDGCAPLTVTLVNTSNPSDIGGNCFWDIGPTTSTACDTVVFTYDVPGSYDVSLTFDSPNGCTGTATMPGYINVYGNPEANFVFGPQPTTILNPTINFVNTSSPDAVFFDWTFDIYGTSDLENPSFTFDGEIPNFYETCLRVTNQWGCEDSICHIVEIQGEFILYVPNAITADGDGVNDYFFPVGAGFDNEDYELMVFNRWGELIFESHRASEQWDGTYKGQKVKQDVYVWKIKCRNEWTNEKKEYYGHVTVLR